jgi:hypothetical protein
LFYKAFFGLKTARNFKPKMGALQSGNQARSATIIG